MDNNSRSTAELHGLTEGEIEESMTKDDEEELDAESEVDNDEVDEEKKPAHQHQNDGAREVDTSASSILEELHDLPDEGTNNKRASFTGDLSSGDFDDSEVVFQDSCTAFPLDKIDENAAATSEPKRSSILEDDRERKMAIAFKQGSFGSISTCPSAPELARGSRYAFPGAVAVRRGTWEGDPSGELSLEYSAEFRSGSKTPSKSVAEFGTVAELAPDREEEVEALVQKRLNERLNPTVTSDSSRVFGDHSSEIVYGVPMSVDRLIEESGASRRYLKKKTVIIWLLAILVVAIVAGALLGIFLTKSPEDEATIEGTSSPTAAPTSGFLTERLSGIIGNPKIRSVQSDAQRKALQWMQRNDTYTAMNFDLITDAALVERYAAAVFLFSMTDSDVSKTSLQYLMPNVTTCEWAITDSGSRKKGFECEDNYVTKLLFENQGFIGTIPSDIVLFQNLIRIELWQNSVFGSIPTRIGDLSLLEHLRVGRNQITGAIPDSLTTLTNLITLQLSTNKLTGTIPQAIADVSNLIELSLSVNQLTGTVPEAVGSLTNLEAVRFFNNYYLGGSIPTGIWSLSRLLRIDAFSCQFTGTIPNTIGSLTKVSDLGVFNNSMTGTLPTEVGLMTSLVWFRVNDNPMNGMIPTELGLLDRLERFTIENTNIGGSLPSEMGMLTAMRYFDGSNSSLTGEVPSSFSALTDLRFFLLHGTNQSGSLEDVYCSDFSDREFVTLATSYCEGGENEQPSSIECSCCNACCDAEKCYMYES